MNPRLRQVLARIPRPSRKGVRRIAAACLACLGLYAAGLVAVYVLFSDNLPDIDELETFQPKRVTKVYSSDGQHLFDFKLENRELIRSYDEIPQAMRDALISVEDRRFFSHWGIDLHRIVGAVVENVKRRDPTAQGASTLTQQLARNLYRKVGTQRSSDSFGDVLATYARKIREQITAVHVERLYTKREILVMYLNTVFFGYDAYGLKSAARLYFDKEAADLEVEECALLAGLLKAPNTYSPFNNRERAVSRRNLVLEEMVKAGKLDAGEGRRLSREPARIRRGRRSETYGLAPYFVEYVRQRLDDDYGPKLYREGYSVYTTLDATLQGIAEEHFSTQIAAVQARVDAWIARQAPAHRPDRAGTLVQGAFVVMDPANGDILVMIGGRDFGESKWNRAHQALRQAGSSFKPFVYTAAIDNNRFPIDVYDDNSIVIEEADGRVWTPENYDHKFKGPVTLRQGLKESRNIIALKLAQDLGPARVAQYARQMGIRDPINEFYSIGIGSSEVRLLDMVAAYSVFPNRGVYVRPVPVRRIEDSDGNLIYQSSPERQAVLRPAVAVVMTDLMRSVMDEAGGTGRSARFRHGFRWAAAGKTGTTNDYRDAWFLGFTPHLVAGVWVGVDDPRTGLASQAGAAAALPLWARFMKQVYDEVEPYRRLRGDRFDYPEDLVEYRAVCEDTHRLATRYCPNQSEEIFIRGGAMPEACPRHGVDDPGGPAAAGSEPPRRRRRDQGAKKMNSRPPTMIPDTPSSRYRWSGSTCDWGNPSPAPSQAAGWETDGSSLRPSTRRTQSTRWPASSRRR